MEIIKKIILQISILLKSYLFSVASNAWLETLLNATEVLPLDIVKSNILGVAINKGQISQNVAHRIAACKLLGKISSRFESQM